MTRKYSLVMESGPSGLSAHVPELSTILVTGGSVEELRTRAAEAIQVYWDVIRAERSPTSTLDEIEVELPAQMTCNETRKNFVVIFKSGDAQPLVASSYCVDEECLIFLDEEEDLVAFFDILEVADWNPKRPGNE